VSTVIAATASIARNWQLLKKAIVEEIGISGKEVLHAIYCN